MCQSFTKAVLIIVATVCILIGLFLTLIIVDMFQHPRGVGMEYLAGPLFGFIALGFFFAGGACLYAVSRLGKSRIGPQS